MTLSFFIEADSSVEMLLSIFYSFSYMQQTFTETLVYSRHCIRCWECKEIDITPNFDQGVYSPSRETKGNVGDVLVCGGCCARCL